MCVMGWCGDAAVSLGAARRLISQEKFLEPSFSKREGEESGIVGSAYISLSKAVPHLQKTPKLNVTVKIKQKKTQPLTPVLLSLSHSCP